MCCIDGTLNNKNNKINNKINLKYVDVVDDKYIDNTPNLSARSYAVLVIEPYLETSLQKDLVHRFNKYLNEIREKYHSLFLTEYRGKSKKSVFHLILLTELFNNNWMKCLLNHNPNSFHISNKYTWITLNTTFNLGNALIRTVSIKYINKIIISI